MSARTTSEAALASVHRGLTIQAVRTTPVVVPLARPISTASGQVDCAPLILIDLETREGVTGRAYLFAYFPFALKPLDALVRELAAMVVGAAVHPQALDAMLRARFTLLGGTRGLAGLAIAGLDMAAWDALAIAAGLPLARMLGAAPKPIRAYNSFGMIRPDGAGEAAEDTVSQGMTGLKIKIGWPTLAEDLAVVRAVRRALPDTCALMVDFNQSLDATSAIIRSRALDQEGVYWIEEPVRCDDFAGSAAVARAVETPIQIGENMAGTFELQTSLAASASDLLMLDVQQIGGVTGWMRGAALAHAAGRAVSSHAFVEISSHLLASTPTCDWLEYFDKAHAILAEPFPVRQGCVSAPDTPGTGLTWDMEAVKRYQI
jgi:mandelate racemase